eukprot:c16715_g1_i1.p2 GENE.c16715_g1_i1~~c16715_g1_i1.p2  ORF type:complete len:284 (-),score=-98.59 c16715_g1_i1:362-1213(-)
MKFTSTGNNVLARVFSVAQNKRVRLGQTLHAFDQLGQISSVLRLDGNTHDRGHGIFHDLDVVGNRGGGNCTTLQQELIDTNQTDSITAGNVLYLFHIATHHQHGTLNILDEQVILLARSIVGAHNSDLLTSGNGTREDTTESVEATLVGSRHHLRNVHHEGTVGIAGLDGHGGLIIHRTFVQVLNTISLSLARGRQMRANHLKQGVGAIQPLLHNVLQQGLAHQILLVTLKSDTELLEHLLVLGLVIIHDIFEQRLDGIHNELAESSAKDLAIVTLGGFLPLL